MKKHLINSKNNCHNRLFNRHPNNFTLPNTLVIIPNSKIAGTIITDYSKPVPEMAVVFQCGVDYKSDLDKAEKITIVMQEISKNSPWSSKNL